MRVLLIGGNGLLGKALSRELKLNNIEFSTASRSEDNDFKIDISKFSSFDVLPNSVFDVVINCASVLPGGNYLDNDYLNSIHNVNILGTQNICKWIDTQKSIKKIVNCSSLAVVNKPWPIDLNEEATTYPLGSHVLYCSSKLTQELIFETFASNNNIDLSQIRFSALYGEEMIKSGVIWSFINQALGSGIISIENGSKVSSDFLNVSDASKILLEVIKGDIYGIINGASGEETSLIKLAEAIKLNIGESIKITNIDNPSFKTNRSVVNISKLKTNRRGIINNE